MVNEGIFYILQNNLDIPAYLSDWAIGSFLNDNRKREYRNGFEIPYEEEIMYCRDTSFWNSADQGIVFTDNGIHFCWNNDDKANNSGFLPWYLITNAEYREDCLCFLYNGELCQINLDHCVKESDINVRIQLGNKLAYVINLIAQHIAEQTQSQRTENDYIVDQFVQEFNDLYNQNQEEAASYGYSQYAEHTNPLMLVAAMTADNNANHVLEVFNQEFDNWRDDDETRNILFSLYSKNLLAAGYTNLARAKTLEAYNTIPEDQTWFGYNVRENVLSDFNIANSDYVEHFLEIPYQERKVLFVTDGYSTLEQNSIAVLHINELDNLTFPIGHPMVNQLYVAHPLIQNHYIPFENYEVELIQDRVREFCSLMEGMGATSITVGYQQFNVSESESYANTNALAAVGMKFYSAQASVNQQETNKFMQSLGQSLNLHQTYNPFQQPFIPDNLIWYPQEPTWQRLVEQRLRGSITSHTESIETNKTQVINNDSLSEIQAELQVLLSNANLEISTSTSETLKQHDNVVLQIHVEFAPLWSLGQTEYQEIPSQESELTENEQEYLEMFQETLADGNGSITNSSRKLLSKFANRLGITAHRATQLEQMYLPSFTTEEKEFIEEVRTVIDEDGELTNMSIRLLHKLATKLGISEQRAEELINIAT